MSNAKPFQNAFVSTDYSDTPEWQTQVTCPVCDDPYTHPVGTREVNSDNYEAWGGRGSLNAVQMRCESGHDFQLCIGFHKGNSFAFVTTDPNEGGKEVIVENTVAQAIAAARTVTPQVRAILEAEAQWQRVGKFHLEHVRERIDAMVRNHGQDRAFWLDYFRTLLVDEATPAPVVERKPDPLEAFGSAAEQFSASAARFHEATERAVATSDESLPPSVWQKRADAVEAASALVFGSEKNEKRRHFVVTDLWRETAHLIKQLNGLKVPAKNGKLEPLGSDRIAEMLKARGAKVSDATLNNIRRLEDATSGVSQSMLTTARDGLKALLAELTAKPDPDPKGKGAEWVSGFEPIESTKPEREKASDDVRALQALAAGTMWPNVVAARFGWSETYMTQVMNRLSGQGRVKRDERGRYYITHLGRKATLEAAA